MPQPRKALISIASMSPLNHTAMCWRLMSCWVAHRSTLQRTYVNPSTISPVSTPSSHIQIRSRAKMISNVTNCMTDGSCNHATIVLVNEAWEKTLNELNCHLHPLDTIASSARSALKQLETVKDKLFGTDCVVGNLVIQLNKLRFKDGKGDPRGFKAFLKSERLSSGFIPRYRGNRLHILFDIWGKYFAHYDAFSRFLMSGTVADHPHRRHWCREGRSEQVEAA